MTDLLGPASAPNAVTVRLAESRTFTSSDTFFKPCSSASANDGTAIQAAWLNQVTATLRALARGAGKRLDAVTPVVAEDNSSDTLLLDAVTQTIQRGQTLFSAAGGTANALTASFTPTPVELKTGMLAVLTPLLANTAAAVTYNHAALGVKTVLRFSGATLQIGDLQAAPSKALLVYDSSAASGAGAWLLLNPATQPGKQMTGFSTPGVTSFTAPFDAWYWFEVYGGGGGAANSNVGGYNTEGGGGGGCATGWQYLTAGTVVPITVGAAGVNGTGYASNGTAGGTSSAGAYFSATGGTGATVAGAPGAGGAGSGGLALTGQSGTDGSYNNFPQGFGGDGAGPNGGKCAKSALGATWPGGGGTTAVTAAGALIWSGAPANGGVIIRY